TIGEQLGIPPLKELNPKEILTPASLKYFYRGLPPQYFVFQRGYCLDQQGYIDGLNISFSNLNPALSAINMLKHITILNIEHSIIDNPTFLLLLPHLKGVNFRFLFLTDWQFIKELKNLSFIDLSSTNISDISIIGQLKNLSSLALSYNNIDNISMIEQLKNLLSLDLSNNNISDISMIGQLKKLSSLDLSFNKISDISILEQLKNLSSLNLSSTNISDISILGQLKNLSSLDLSSTNISDFSILGQLKNLSSLNLSSTNISDISILGQLKNLSSLNLSSTNISDISILGQLKNLSSLNLENSNISDISILKQLKNLTSLNLRDNNISDISILSQLKNLSSLDLRNNDISDISILGKLINLTSLDLRNTNTEDISIIGQLKKLSSLDLRNNSISNIFVIGQLKNLLSLDLRNTNTYDISILGQLKKLTSLNLRDNNISDISIVGQLKDLSSLDLRNNNISNITILGQLKSLSSLDLRNNNISNITVLKHLKNLSTLDLRDNNIADISVLGQLRNLLSLDLRNNNISDISIIGQLKNLSSLDLRNNNISDISALGQLKNLSSLYLSSNKISNISMIGQLRNISSLDLSSNNISDIIILEHLKNISSLDLRNNNIKHLFPLNNFKNLQNFGINNNPLEEPPKDIAEQGIEAIQNYFRQLEDQGKDYCYEAKIMIVGEPGAGKSSLMRKLFNREYEIPNTSLIATTGIEVKSGWTFPYNRDKEFIASIWDFGGQQIQYMLHQFFLTESCVYILMAEKRKELANFDYWLNILHILGKESPVIILFNEINIDSVSNFIFDEKKYRELFPEMKWIRLDINLAKKTDGRLDVLINTIREKLRNLPYIGRAIPAQWKIIRETLEKRQAEKLMSLEVFLEVCASYNITQISDQLLILRYFHLLGVVLHFDDDPRLRETLFLDPNWTVNAIYSILSDNNIEQYKGIVPLDFMKSLWDKNRLSYIEQTRLLNLMLKDAFELCYEHPAKQDYFIIPLLLPKAEPPNTWDTINNDNSLCFRFQYPFMPKGITNRLMVRLNEIIENNIVWQEGVLFTWENAHARVIEKKTTREGLKIIEITLKGMPDKRKELLTIIRQEIKKIQKNSFPQLPYYEMVPCTCPECIDKEEKRFFVYSDLQNLLKKGKHQIMCPASGEILDIRQLYDTVIDDQAPKHWPPQSKKEEYFDVFLCHNSKDKTKIKEIGTKLKTAGIKPWLDEWHLRPGDIWIDALEKQINGTKTALIFIGPEGNGPWQTMEIRGFLQTLAEKRCRIIPVILPDCTEEPEISLFLKPITWVDYRKTDPDPFKQLLFGITGQNPENTG
ncbi:MAG: leucine-rich repeat domain-containing protein, partial [Spirochaetales bacterium]|nr:leucine-rich repeat domain-containing protein [Spirochaetales bacterium]